MDAQTLPDARWSCRGCGDCCRGFSFGPVEPGIIAGLRRADIGALWPPAAAQPWHAIQPGPDGQPAAYLTSVDGHCIFLQEDQYCAVHRLLGGDRKPWFCREYPFYPVEDADGRVSVTVRGDCGGLHESFDDGELLTDQLPTVLALPRIVPRARFAPPQVVLLPGMAISVEAWRQVEPHLLQHLSALRTPEAAIATTRTNLYAMASRPVPPPQAAHYRQAMATVLSTLQREVPYPPLAQALRRWDGRIPKLDDDATRYVMLLMRGALLTRQFGSVGVPALLGLCLVETAVSALNTDAEAPLSPSDLGETMPRLKRWLRAGEAWSMIQDLRPALEALFSNAA
jgi:Fe-S-cluster containining protein